MGKTTSRRFFRDRQPSGSLFCGKTCVVFFFLFLIFTLMGAERVPFHSIPAQAAEKDQKPTNLSMAIIQIARQAIPAVVHIEVTSQQEVANPMSPFESDPFFRRFFNVPKMPKKFKR